MIKMILFFYCYRSCIAILDCYVINMSSFLYLHILIGQKKNYIYFVRSLEQINAILVRNVEMKSGYLCLFD